MKTGPEVTSGVIFWVFVAYHRSGGDQVLGLRNNFEFVRKAPDLIWSVVVFKKCAMQVVPRPQPLYMEGAMQGAPPSATSPSGLQ